MLQITLLFKKLPLFFILLLFTLKPFFSMAQMPVYFQTDTLKKEKNLKFIAPAVMLGVGALGLESYHLQKINKSIRHTALQAGLNSTTHIEDGLRYVPAASTFLLQSMGVKGKHNMVDKLFLFAISTAIVDQSVGRLKSKTKELRPDGSNYRSFPSGHTTTAFAAAEFMRKEYGDVSPWITVGAYAIATTTGALRIYHNSHWLTDVVAGAGLGILSTDLAYIVYPKIKKLKLRKTNDQNLSITPAFQNKTLGLNVVYKIN